MSLYNMMKGFNPVAGLCLKMLSLNPSDIPRFRDAWLTDDGERIVLLTRTGGGNRSDYLTENQSLTKIDGYISDVDDDFDSTFAHFMYKVPAAYILDTKLIGAAMLLAGKGEDKQGPSAVIGSMLEDSAVGIRLDADNPVIAEGIKAYKRVAQALGSDGREA